MKHILPLLVLVIAFIPDALTQRRGCRYERVSEDVTECKNRRLQMTLKLIEGDPQNCDATVTRQKRCRNVGPKTPAQRSGCRYRAPVVGDCDPVTLTQNVTRALYAEKSAADCGPSKIKTRTCRLKGNQRRIQGLQEKSRREDRQERKKERREKAAQEARIRKMEKQAQRGKSKLREQGKLVKQIAMKTNGFYTCQYVRAEESECENGMRTRVDTLIPGSSKDCDETRTVHIFCEEDYDLNDILNNIDQEVAKVEEEEEQDEENEANTSDQ